VTKADSNIARKVKNLKFEYSSKPQPGLLVSIPNPYPDQDYQVEINYGEFTCLCPLNLSQPDYAAINVKYSPDRFLVEFKSLKFYFVSYRNVATYHEEATNRILKDLVALLKPFKMEINGDWNIRGGTRVRVSAFYTKPRP
jgi:7-cyano-7-deazaguanine reductase